MKILYVTHQLAFNRCGGAEVQMAKTRKYITNLDNELKIKYFDMWKDMIEDYDMVHIFAPKAFPLESSRIIRYSKEKNVKIVISPIFYETNELIKDQFKLSFSGLLIGIYLFLRSLLFKIGFINYLTPYKFLYSGLKDSDVILPNTNEELKLLSKMFPGIETKCSVIPNGVDIKFKDGNSKLFESKYKINDFILFVGRIEYRKNLLRLIRAFIKSNLKTNLVIIGKIEDYDYYNLCKKESNEKVIFVPPMPHDSEILKSAYKSAKVLALPSFLETPGLSALEGGLAGANIVITKIGGTNEYFEDYAFYIDPFDEKDIQKSLISAYNAPSTDELSKHIQREFTWDKVAQKTLDVYSLII